MVKLPADAKLELLKNIQTISLPLAEKLGRSARSHTSPLHPNPDSSESPTGTKVEREVARKQYRCSLRSHHKKTSFLLGCFFVDKYYLYDTMSLT